MQIIGDIKGKCCVIVDDICDTAGTLCHAADALKMRVRQQYTRTSHIPYFQVRLIRTL